MNLLSENKHYKKTAHNMGLAKAGAESYHLEDFSTFRRKKPFRFSIFCNFEKTKMVFARFGFSWNFRPSYPRLRQALSRYLQKSENNR